jgi:hypothetical protein
MAQAVSLRPLPVKAPVRTRVSRCGIFGVQSGTGTGFSPSSSVFPRQYHCAVALPSHTYITGGGGGGAKSRPVGGQRSDTQKHPNDTNKVNVIIGRR